MIMETAAMHAPRSLAHQRGLSIIEFLVGLAVGLFVVGGAAKLFVDYIGSNRTLLLETRVNQDLRAAADLVARDLRRAGYWRNSPSAMYVGASAPTAANPYAGIALSSGTLTYAYAKDNDNALAAGTEAFGFRASGGALQMLVGGNWQQLTDPNTLTINAGDLSITETAPRVVDLFTTCPCIGKLTCTQNSFKDPNPDTGVTGTNFATRPRVVVRQYVVSITGRAPANANIVRTLTEVVRPRNDQSLGACPV
jgi:prepilin peptidase dependent protein B